MSGIGESADHGPAGFVHLRVHSAYSLLEGALPIARLAQLARRMAMPALAITDTNNLFGALEFSEKLAGAGVQPIIGCTLAVRFDDEHEPASLALLAKDAVGYGNLMKLSSAAFLESPADASPHVPASRLEALGEGLICLTGGPSGPLNREIVANRHDQAVAICRRLEAIFADRLYIELQRHNDRQERLAEDGLIDIAYERAIPLVASNQAYFEGPDDFAAHDALICIAEGAVVASEERRSVTPEHYLKSPREMRALFADIPEAVDNTLEIARRCAFRPHPRKPILPVFADGGKQAEADELRREARAGLAQRMAAHGPAEGYSEADYEQRLEYELGVIIEMDFPGYFLIVADFIKYAKANAIPVGPGRGSGAGSVVAWALTITDLDPLRFNLVFERFLNPQRVSMPDFDIDFCQERRDEVIAYVQEKYGREQVAQIITFGKLQARAVCRDVGRVLQMPYGQVDRLCKLIPNNPANPVTLSEAIEGEPRLREARDSDETVARMLEIGLKLEGLYRHASTHAAGVVIGDRRLDELVPLYRDPRSDMPVTQFNMKEVEKAGLVKFDFLGLKTLSVIDNAVKLIARRGVKVDPGAIPLDDEETFAMLRRAQTTGVFQLESSGMRDLIRKSQPGNIEDIIALVALYRPGPMENIPKYIACKKGEEQPEFLHETITPIVADTYGVIIYQEQVLQIAQALAGYSLGEADILRRAMGKKIKAEMDQQKERFVSGALANGVDKAQAEFIFELVAKFAGYGFNKAHSACYGVIAYQTAWLKANHPVEFIAASMTFDMGNTDKLQVFQREARDMGITVNAPDINAGEVEFTVVDGAVGYSLAALKNVGRAAVEHIVAERQRGGAFSSLADFAARIDPHVVNKRALESLAKAGAFDTLEPNRARVLAGVETMLALANRTREAVAVGQSDLFAGGGEGEALPLPKVEAWLPLERLAREFEAVGFYISGHPLDDYERELDRLGVEKWSEFRRKAVEQGINAARLAGTVAYVQNRRSRNGNRFAFVGFSDPSGQFEAVCFADTLAQTADLLEPGTALVVRVEADIEGEEVRLRISGVELLEDAVKQVAPGLCIYLEDMAALEGVAARLQNGGRSPVRLVVPIGAGREAEVLLGEHFTVTPQIKAAIKAVRGVGEVRNL